MKVVAAMKRPEWLVLIASTAVLSAYGLISNIHESPKQMRREGEQRNRLAIQQHERWNHFRNIVRDVLPLIEACQKKGVSQPSISGKVLIWDVKNDSFFDKSSRLPSHLQAGIYDEQLTIFMITNFASSHCAEYRFERDATTLGPLCRGAYEVAVSYWPAKTAVGVITIEGPEPPQSISWSNLESGRHRLLDEETADKLIEAIRVLPRSK
jgi:hypothetical protein